MEDTVQLIQIVKDKPYLYDPYHDDYTCSKKKRDAWNTIAKQLGYENGKAVKDSWRKLRDCHRDALRRQLKKKNEGETRIRPWLYQKRMEFLLPYMTNKFRFNDSSNINNSDGKINKTSRFFDEDDADDDDDDDDGGFSGFDGFQSFEFKLLEKNTFPYDTRLKRLYIDRDVLNLSKENDNSKKLKISDNYCNNKVSDNSEKENEPTNRDGSKLEEVCGKENNAPKVLIVSVNVNKETDSAVVEKQFKNEVIQNLVDDKIIQNPVTSIERNPDEQEKNNCNDNASNLNKEEPEEPKESDDLLLNSPIKKEPEKEDVMFHFFMSMYSITKKMPMLAQLQVRKKVFTAVSEAEEELFTNSDVWPPNECGCTDCD